LHNGGRTSNINEFKEGNDSIKKGSECRRKGRAEKNAVPKIPMRV